MPERQSSPGEATARPETDLTENASGHGPKAQVEQAVPAAGTPDQGAEREQAGPVATAPAPDGSAGDVPAANPSEADENTAAPESAAQPGAPAAPAAQPGPSATPEAPSGERPRPTPHPAPAAEPAAAERPRPTPRPAKQPAPADAPAPEQSTVELNAEAPARPRPTPAPAARPEAAAARPVPRPRPAAEPAAEAADEGPTVRTAVGAASGSAPVGSEAAAAEAPTVNVRAGGATTQVTRPTEGNGSWFNPTDGEATQALPRTPPPPGGARGPVDPPTERIPLTETATGLPPTADADGPGGGERRRRRRPLLIVAAVVGVLALLYVGDLLLSSGSVPRGVTVAGVRIGGLGMAEAEQRLRSAIEPRTTQPVAVTVGPARSELDPTAAGLTVDWAGTLEQAGTQPLNPITRITSFFTTRDVAPVTTADDAALTAALEQLSPIVNRAPVEGTVQFEGTTPVPVDPVAGQELDVQAAAEVLRTEWAAGDVVDLPLTELPPTTTPEDVTASMEGVARPAVSAPVTVLGEGGTQGVLEPEVIATVLSFRAEDGELVPEINSTAVTEALTPQLAASERPGRDASLDFSSGTPVVVPSQDGRGVDYEATVQMLLPALTTPAPREITAVYADQPAELTTEELNALGITGVIGEFTTGGFAADSGQNIRRAAEQIDGTVVAPGETFSLNAATNPRNAANGYVEAGIIQDGHPARGIGGGVSQVATTLYNAAYFAGMVDVEHREHSFYISRYPAGREATVYNDVIDVKFRNDNPTGVLIETVWTPQSLTVRLNGTKRYEVTSTPGPRTNPTEPHTVTIPAGEPCSPSRGAPGFTITDTRTLREISTGEVSTETRTVTYNPSPIVICGG
ncbi:VanW family protein [Pseudonocardia nigra]|uniref:VanW family protein n=1 Tax=Pseudonocardia nigra TaxID=1921578 RepID=UPI001C5E645A|nr:VanW family protein [Pseudonocardia nigra]